MKNKLDKFIWQEMHILHANSFIKHSWKMNEDLCFMPNLIQIIIEVVTLSYEPNIHMELHYNLSKNSFNPSLRMMCERELFDIYPYQSMWWQELHLNRK